MPRRRTPQPPVFREIGKLREWERIQAGLARLRDRFARIMGEVATAHREINELWAVIDAHFRNEGSPQ